MSWLRRSSPSFIAVVLLALGVIGYFGWQHFRSNDIQNSEDVVRRFASSVAREVGPLRRQIRKLTTAPAPDAAGLEKAKAEIDHLANQARERIEDIADKASNEIETMSGISLKTQDNRIDRIERRKQEADGEIGSLAAQAKQELSP